MAMRRYLSLWGMVLLVCACSLAQPETTVVLDGTTLSVAPAEELYGTIVSARDYQGGLDAGQPGDEAAYRLTKIMAGLVYYDCAAEVGIPVTLPAGLTSLKIEVGYAKYQWGSPKGTASWDGRELCAFSCSAPQPHLLTATYELTTDALKAGKHTMTLADVGGGYVHIDAVRLRAAGALEVGKPVPRIEMPAAPTQAEVRFRELPAHAAPGATRATWAGNEQYGFPVCSGYRSMWADISGYKTASYDDADFVTDMALYQPQSYKIYGGVRVPQARAGFERSLAGTRTLPEAARAHGSQVQMASGMYVVPCSGVPGTITDGWQGAAWDPIADLVGPTPRGTGRSWLQVDAKGQPTFNFYQGKHYEWYGCPNNPNYYLYMKGYWVAQALAGGKGGYIDNPSIRPGGCYCDFCKAGFRRFMAERFTPAELHKHFGVADAATIDPPTAAASPLMRQWHLFRRDSMAGFMKRLCDDLHQRDPEFALSCNMGGEPGPGYVAGAYDLIAMGAACDYLYVEIGSGPRRVHFRYTTSPCYQFLAACAKGKLALPLGIARLFRDADFGRAKENPASLESRTVLQLAEAAAYGASYEPHLSVCRLQPAYGRGVAQWLRFVRENEALYREQSTLADVGVVCSTSAYYVGVSPWFLTSFRLLADSKTPAVALLPDQLTDTSLGARYRCLVLPPTPMLSDAEIAGLVRYVTSGGSLILIGESGGYDQRGLARERNALVDLYQALQVDLKQPPQDVPVAAFGHGKLAYIAAPPGEETVYMAEGGQFDWKGSTFLGLAAVVERLRQAPPLLKVEAGPLVEATLMHRQNPAALLVNILNYDITYQTAAKPAKDIVVDVAIPAGRQVTKATALSPGAEPRELKIVTTAEGGATRARVKLPEVMTYAAVVFE